MQWRFALVLLLLAACSKITQDNYLRIRDGMTEQEVVALLGAPTESSSMSVLGVSGTTLRWEGHDGAINVHFVNGKVAMKVFERPLPVK
ncbi:MAG: hypothetical protein JOZ85_07485 [Betaproteobacteria bacterium]|nr:hypothetical protein [Betaproteobacteria bacterium]